MKTTFTVKDRTAGTQTEHKTWHAAVRAASECPEPVIIEEDRRGSRELNIFGEVVRTIDAATAKDQAGQNHLPFHNDQPRQSYLLFS